MVYVCSFALPKGADLNGSVPGGGLPPFYNVKYVGHAS